MANKFNPQGQTKVLWVSKDGIADIEAPTVTELSTDTSGVIDLTCGIMPDGIEGFSNEPTEVDATTFCSTMAESVPGIPTTTPGALTMARASTSNTDNYTLFEELKDLVAGREEGYVVMALDGWGDTDDGPAAGDIVDVFPSLAASINANPLGGAAIGTYVAGFTHPAPFALNVSVAGGGGG